MTDRSEPTLLTFGCRLNTYESEVIRSHAADGGNADDLIVVNTCAVTAEAERRARQAIRKVRRDRPGARIVVTGCAAQIDPQRWAAMDEVDRVVGNEEKLKAETWAGADSAGEARVAVNDIMSVRETAGHLVRGLSGRTRAFVQVQQGCDHRCTFCIIPFGRGNNRSVPIGEIVTQIRTLVEGGYREVVLTGVDITDFGKDLPGTPTLGQLCRRLLALVPDLPRLRLSSLDPVEVDDDLLRLVAEEPRLMPHFHLSIQAGDDMILKRMKRRHLRDDAIGLCTRIRDLRPDVVFGADLIAGFPTETEAMFTNSLDIVEACGLTHLHVFPYSARPGTPAARMPQVPGELRKDRAQRLRKRGARALRGFLDSRIGAPATVLVERAGRGLSEHYAEVLLPEEDAAPGEIVRATVTGRDGDSLTGRLAA